MAAYVFQRLLWLIPVLLFISLVTFVLMHSVEGGPWDDDRKLPDSVVQNLNRRYGLDKPVWRQYLTSWSTPSRATSASPTRARTSR